MKTLKKEILSQIPEYNSKNINWYSLEEFEDYVYEKNGYRIYSEVIQRALDKYKCVKIQKTDTLYIDKPIIMKSGYRLLLDKNQIISNVPGTSTCLIRNEHLITAESEPSVHENFDTDISVDGGIWDGGLTDKNSDVRLMTGNNPEYKGAISIMIFTNVENLVIENAEFSNGAANYAVQIGSISKFYINNLRFVKYTKDGVHINGPASYGEVCNLYGEDMGDDMVAVNAWDWDTSAITFGTIENIYMHDNVSSNNEFRLLPGRKMYKDCYTECEIRNCIFENLSGVYTFKLYCQPNIKNAIVKGYDDTSGDVGSIYNIWFKNIKIEENKQIGLNGLPVNGIFDVCANCHNLYFEDIEVLSQKQQLYDKNMRFMSVGPLSAVWKNDSENPDDWGEVFAPDSVCHVEDIYFKNIMFKDGKAEDENELVKTVKLEINQDYPNTTPKGGTGYGTVGKIVIEK